MGRRSPAQQGRAGTIEYDVRNDTVRLAGDAWLTDGQNEIRGQKLVYDIGKQRVAANPGATEAGGVKITINPKQSLLTIQEQVNLERQSRQICHRLETCPKTVTCTCRRMEINLTDGQFSTIKILNSTS